MRNKILDLYVLAVKDGVHSKAWDEYTPILYNELYTYETGSRTYQEETDIVQLKIWMYEHCPKLISRYVSWKKEKESK